MIKTYYLPVSVKGIVFDENKVWLRKNERNEWELPGGKLEKGEQPHQTLERELEEELGFNVEVIEIVQSYLYTIQDSIDESHGVFVVIYLCELVGRVKGFETIGEAGKSSFRKFSLSDIVNINMPDFYKESIKKSVKLINI